MGYDLEPVKTRHVKIKKPCSCPVCNIQDQFGVDYPRHSDDKCTAIIPFLPPLFMDDDGRICEGTYIDACAAVEAGFCRTNRLGGHLVLPKWILNCKPEVLTKSLAESDAWPKKDNGDPKPFFKVFCLPNGDMIIPREFVEPKKLPANLVGKTVPVYVNENCQAVVPSAEEKNACGIKLAPNVTLMNLDVGVTGTEVGQEIQLIDEVGGTMCVPYTNDTGCPVIAEFQSSQSITVEIMPGAFAQFGNVNSGTGSNGGGSSTPGWWNKTDEPTCHTFETLHNNCVCLDPGESYDYKVNTLVRFQSPGEVTIKSIQKNARVCFNSY